MKLARSSATRLVSLTDDNLDEVMAAPLAAVVVSDERSSQSARYLAELHAAQGRGEFGDVPLAIFDRATAGDNRFGREQDWVRHLRVLPYTVIYSFGKKVDEFATIRAETLTQRLSRQGRAKPLTSASPLDRVIENWRPAPLGVRPPAA